MPNWFRATRYPLPIFLILVLLSFYSCEKKENQPDPDTNALMISIKPDISYQTIAGFGGANRMRGNQFLKPVEAKKAFGTGDDELGLSIFRVRIASNKDEWPLILESVREARQYGAKILASPWSPPAALKSNNSDTGGYLLPEHYAAFKNHLNAFIQYMASNGVSIYAISIQNEPDIQVSYESCDWSATAMGNFLKDYGYLIEGARIAAPESFNFNPEFSNSLLSDAGVADQFDILAGHIYGGGLGAFPLAEQRGKEVWMTEYLLNLQTGNTGAPAWTSYDENAVWEETLQMLTTVHEAMTHNWNAYVWWYLQRYYSFIGDGEQGTINGEILKRGYAFSHYSKYIRPEATRIEAQPNRPTDLKMTAYDSTDKTVIVILNTGEEAVGNVHLLVPSLSSAVAFVSTPILSRREKDLKQSENSVIIGLLPKSITTVVISK